MMEFVEYMKIKKRMTKTNNGDCLIHCHKFECPLHATSNGHNLNCIIFERMYPEKAEAIVQKWADEHPRKTILQEFLEHYPNAKLNENGLPIHACPHYFGYENMIDSCNWSESYRCIKCWNQPVPKKE